MSKTIGNFIPILRNGLSMKSIISKPVPVPGIASPPGDTDETSLRKLSLGGGGSYVFGGKGETLLESDLKDEMPVNPTLTPCGTAE